LSRGDSNTGANCARFQHGIQVVPGLPRSTFRSWQGPPARAGHGADYEESDLRLAVRDTRRARCSTTITRKWYARITALFAGLLGYIVTLNGKY
jgi:hypothetical protein